MARRRFAPGAHALAAGGLPALGLVGLWLYQPLLHQFSSADLRRSWTFFGAWTIGSLTVWAVAAALKLRLAVPLTVAGMSVYWAASSRQAAVPVVVASFLLAAFLLAWCGAALARRFAGIDNLPLWAGLLVSLVVLYQPLLLLGIVGHFSLALVLVLLVALAAIGACEFAVRGRPRLAAWLSAAGEFEAGESILTVAAAALLILMLTAANAPESAFDAMRYYVPIMVHIAATGAIRPDYNSWIELTYLAMQTLGAAVVLLVGKAGAGLFCGWLFSALGWMLIRNESYRVGASRTAAAAAAFVVLATPDIFRFGGTAYYDIAFSAFCVGGIVLVRRGLDGDGRECPLGAALLAFAFLTKGFATVFILAALGIFLATRRDSLKRLRGRLAWSAIAFMAVLLPRLLVSYTWVANPFFPLGHDHIDPRFTGFAQTLLPGKDYFSFPHGVVVDALGLPALLTFWVPKIAEGLPGQLGAYPLILAPLWYVTLVAVPWRLRRADGQYVAVASCAWLAISLGHAPYARYWYPCLFLTAIAMAVRASEFPAAGKRQEALARWLNWLVPIGLAFVFVLHSPFAASGAFVEQDWKPWAFHRGHLSTDEYVRSLFSGVPEFVNARVSSAGTVLSTGYYGDSAIEAEVVDSTPWWDSYNRLASVDDFKDVISQRKVRYWIVNRSVSWLSSYESEGISGVFWRPERRVFDDGTYAVYDLDPAASQLAAALARYRSGLTLALLRQVSVATNAMDSASATVVDDNALVLSFPSSQVDPRRGDFVATTLAFGGLRTGTEYELRFELADRYAGAFPGRLVQMAWFNGRLIFVNDLGTGNVVGVHEVSWRFQAEASEANLRVEVRAVSDANRGWSWGQVPGIVLGRVRLDPDPR